MATADDTDITVSREDFLTALQELVPSVSQTEMEHYRLVQEKFADNGNRLDELPMPEEVDRKGKGRAL
jgi:peroxin-6